MRTLSFALITLLCLTGFSLFGQIPYFQRYHPIKKSQPVQVNTFLQDRSGFIWFGTDKGLFRFDGQTFKQFTVRDSLSQDYVTALAQDSLGTIWIGHQDGTISYFTGGLISSFEPREGSAVEPISDIVFDRDGVMWFSTKNDGLYYYLNERLYRVDEAEGLPDLFIYDLFESPSGEIWAGTDAGIAVCSLRDGKVSIRVIDSDDGLPDIIIKKIRVIDENVIGLATEDAGLLSIDLRTTHIQPVVSPAWDFGTISDFVVKERQIWIAAPGRGVVVYDKGIDRVKVYREFDGSSLLSVNALLADQEGNVWSGLKAGLLRTKGDAVEHIETLHNGSSKNVLALTVDADDKIWYSTSEGLFVRSHNEGSSPDTSKKLKNNIFRNVPIISLYVDAKGYIWAGLYGDGLVRIHPRTYEIKHFNKELRNGNILSITGKGDTLWVATLGGSSMILDKNGTYQIDNYSSAEGLVSDFIYQVFVDSKNRTWFATDGKGISMLDESGFHHYQEGLPSQVIYSITEDVNKNIWVSSQDNGILLFQDGRFISVPEVRLRDNSVQSLVADRDGNLIAFHNFGIDVYDVNRKQMRYWGEESGIRDKEPNLNAVAFDRFGQVFAGMTHGIVKFSLSNDRTISAPKPAIDDIKIFGHSINIKRSPRLRYNENNMTIHFLGFWYQNAANLNYLYKLENYDLEWIETKNQEVTYSRLPAGDYTFRVKVSETEDFSNANETTISFSINPPFWKTGTFFFLVAALFFVSAYGLMKYRERRLLEDKLILEAKVEERTREIQQKTEEIQAQNEEIMAQAEEIQGINENLEMLVKQRTAELEKKNQALEEYAFINAHKLRSPVASILGLVNLLAKADQKEDTRVIREHLQQSADKLDTVVRSITKAIEKADNKYL